MHLMGWDEHLDVGALWGATAGLLASRMVAELRREAILHEQRWAFFARYPDNIGTLRRMQVAYEDCDMVESLYLDILQAMDQVGDDFRDFCARHGLRCTDNAVDRIRAFMQQHCLEGDPLLILRRDFRVDDLDTSETHDGSSSCDGGRPVVGGCYYLTAATPGQRMEIAADLEDGQTPGTAIRRQGRPFMWGRLKALRAPAVRRRSFPPAAGPEIQPDYMTSAEPLVPVTRRRPSAAPAADGVPMVVAQRRTRPATSRQVERSLLLRQQLELLGADSPTSRDVARIESDLQQGRDKGHDLQWLDYRAIDIRIAGRRGRNVWRLLYRPRAAGIRLAGIGNYHTGNGTIRWWKG
ncbi:hypothetical protein [Stenotrophomonas tumulicola]|uniref:Uncharacterized protein n=1 Tax=Stenotrophomonas tumulicola TaxID=1685415 RepID=A0A7W3FM36_9GAMM|nr:hypothetical protein [Stenotrophomonas tumulicola]MBA8682082.1 hypothetical protein [Stenotrophomonas tumulicola]